MLLMLRDELETAPDRGPAGAARGESLLMRAHMIRPRWSSRSSSRQRSILLDRGEGIASPSRLLLARPWPMILEQVPW